jgi:uncharacterized protein
MLMAAFIILLTLAEVLGTIGGFGSSMLVMPIAGLFMPFEQALGLTAIFHLFSNAAKMYLFRQGFDRHLLLWLGLPAVLGVIIGAGLTSYVPERVLLMALGGMLVILSLVLLVWPRLTFSPTNAHAVTGGAISGFVAGLVGTGGALRGITLAAFNLEKSMFVSTSAWIDMGVDLSRSVIYTSQGYVQHVLQFLPGMVVASLVGSWIGKLLLTRIRQEHFRRIVLTLVLIVGAWTLVRSLYP